MQRLLHIIILLSCFTMSFATPADSTKMKRENGLELYLDVKDHLTHNGIDSTLVGQLLNAADSAFVDSLKTDSYTDDGKRYTYATFKITQPGNYLLRFDAEGYDTKYVAVDIPKLYKRESYRQLKTTYLRKAQKKWEAELDEVVVTATKLKFYMDGDTLVYNADAFSLAEGSMLDALLKKLPGVEVNKEGEITVNGKKVNSLLLNGKDFFDSDRELMLENMPAYMVKNIQSYERVPVEAKGTNREKTAQKELVMNVKLKRDYNSGWLATAEGGGGTTFFKDDDGNRQGKFMGRLFALRFSDKSRFTAYANVNNLNDTRTPGEKGEWSPLTQSQGLNTTARAGVSYLHGDWDTGRYNGSFNTSYTESDNATKTNSETFLEGGNTFAKSFSNSRSYSFDINTNHQFYKSFHETSLYKYLSLSVAPSFSFQKWNNNGMSASASFNEDVSLHLGKEWMDSIAAPNAGETLRKFAVNRTLSSTKGNGHYLSTYLWGYLNINPPHNDQLDFTVSYSWSFNDNKSYDYEHMQLDYQQGTSTFQNRYTPSFNRNSGLNISPEATIFIDNDHKHLIRTSYDYSYTRNESNRSLYMLNKLSEWSDGTKNPIGTLPSMNEMLATMDADNSSESTLTTSTQNPSIAYYHVKSTEDKYSSLSFMLSAPIKNETLDHWQGSQVDTVFSRRTTFLTPRINYFKNDWKRGQEIHAEYRYNTNAPSMTSLLDITNTSNPLFITRSNPNLKNSHSHNLSASYRDKFKRSILFNVSADASITQNAVASGFIYNKETGVRTVTPDNVNGNWQMHFRTGIDLPLDSLEKWRIKENIHYNYNHSVDLSGTDPALGAMRSVVGTNNLNNELGVTFRPSGKMEFSAKSNIHYQHSTSERKDFTTINVCDFDYGLAGQIELPHDFQISTDVTMYSRRGYADASMNTNEFVWNARISKRMMKGNLNVMLDAFDLLGNLSNMRRSIDAQGRTETFYNVIPSYALLHISYKLNKR